MGSGVVTTDVISFTSGTTKLGRSGVHAVPLKQKFPLLELLSVTSMNSVNPEPWTRNENDGMKVKTGFPAKSDESVIAPAAPKFVTSVADKFGENGIFSPAKPSSFVRIPAGVNSLSVVPVGTGSVIAND